LPGERSPSIFRDQKRYQECFRKSKKKEQQQGGGEEKGGELRASKRKRSRKGRHLSTKELTKKTKGQKKKKRSRICEGNKGPLFDSGKGGASGEKGIARTLLAAATRKGAL